MKRPWQIWLTFAACVGVAAAAVGWLTLRTMASHRGEALARRQADLEEKVRLALWRMDSAISPLIIRESARPPEAYSADPLPPDSARAAGRSESTSHVLLFFEVDESGRLLIPEFLNADLSGGHGPDDPRGFLDSPDDSLWRTKLLAQLPEPPATLDARGVIVPEPTGPGQADDIGEQQARSNNEYNVRSQLTLNNGVLLQQQVQQYAVPQSYQAPNAPPLGPTEPVKPVGPPPGTPGPRVGAMKPLWHGGRLLLMRRIAVGSSVSAQGCLLDWPAIRADLRKVVGDLLPGADLEPVLSDADDPAHRLAILPVRLVPGQSPEESVSDVSAIRFPLLVAWGSLLIAAVAAAVVLQSVVGLSERRAAFVSAVTHELRTPLTTFRLYAEMLAEGMVADENRARYLATLQGEADRLMHLVENVLSYARLERNPAGLRTETLSVADLLDPMRQRLEERAARGGLRLVVEASDAAAATCVSASASAVEQILLNLVDNACKYAVPISDNRLHLSVLVEHKAVRLRLRDHGPGVAGTARRRLFRPFHKSAGDAAGTAPGVGLGLAFSRRLARAIRGDLRLDQHCTEGATFELMLRRVGSA